MSRRFAQARLRMWQAALVHSLLSALLLLPMIGATRAEEALKRVLHVDSYHAGNQWNDGIVAALRETLAGKGIELRVFHMDSKRHSSDAEIRAAAQEAEREIESFQPDVV